MELKQIKLEGEALVFLDEKSNEIYNIRKDWLPDTIEDGVSDWINQLCQKSWINKAALQEVADIIMQEFPNNQIDWDKTNRIISTQ